MTVFEVTPDRPFSSRTVRVTVNVPGLVYVRVGTGPVPDPLPKFHEYVSVDGFSSVEERPSNEQTFCAQLKVKFATGGRLVAGSGHGDAALAGHGRRESVLVDAADQDRVRARTGSPAWCRRSSTRASPGSFRNAVR